MPTDGHIDPREAKRARGRVSSTKWRMAHPDRDRERRKRHYERNREAILANDKVRKYPGYERPGWLRRLYGISLEEYLAMLSNQSGVCAICRQPETATLKGNVKALCIDHDHVTGKVRALLCSRCNRLLGMVQDDPGLLDIAAAYLRAHAPEN